MMTIRRDAFLRGTIARTLLALTMLAAVSGCGVLKGDKKARTPVLGNRIPVLTSEADAKVEPALAAAPVTVPPAFANDAWAQPGGNAEKALGNVALGAAPQRLWSARITGTSAKARLAAAPVVADGHVFVVDTHSILHAFDANSGAVTWTGFVGKDEDERGHDLITRRPKGNAGALFGGGVSYADGKVYATNGIGDVQAFDAATGKSLWLKRPGGPLRGAPTLAQGNVYVMSQDNQIFALAQASGDTVWNESGTLEASGVFGTAAPAAAQGTVVTGFSSGELTAYRYENGRAVWQDALSRTSISTSVSTLSDIDADPVIESGRVYAVGAGGRMVAMELVTGQRLWELNIAGIDTPWVAGDWLFVLTDEQRLLCIARTSGKVRWISQLPRWKNEKKKRGRIAWNGPVLAGDRLIVTGSKGLVHSVALADGKIDEGFKAGKSFGFAPVVANSTMYLLADDGTLTAWR